MRIADRILLKLLPGRFVSFHIGQPGRVVEDSDEEMSASDAVWLAVRHRDNHLSGRSVCLRKATIAASS